MDFRVNPNLSKPTYSVIMLIFHRSQELVDNARDCIATVKANSPDAEIIIVDNGSTVRYDWEKECDTYVRLDKNWGISHGWNCGLKLARGTYPVIIGDDILVREGWLEAMRKGIEMPNAGMCNPHIEHLPVGEGIEEGYKWPSGACFMLSRNTIEKCGYFSEHLYFPAQHEDWDYWSRIYKNGLKIYTNYELTIRHKEGQTDKAADISVRFQDTRQKFLEEWHFDPTPVFCGAGKFPWER